ncbi:unnamed protein product, partial [Allacma fusca]
SILHSEVPLSIPALTCTTYIFGIGEINWVESDFHIWRDPGVLLIVCVIYRGLSVAVGF